MVSGSGSPGSPLVTSAHVTAWPYPCSVDTFGSTISVRTDGTLVGVPSFVTNFTATSINRNYAPTVIGAGAVTADTFDFNIQNPDTCRPCRYVIFREVIMKITLPGTGTTGPSSAGMTIAGSESWRGANAGTTTLVDQYSTIGKPLPGGTLAAGASTTFSLVVGVNNGTGGATYNRIETSLRVLYIAA